MSFTGLEQEIVSIAAGNSDLLLLLVRVMVGGTMIYYGWPKIKNLKKTAGELESMGFKPGWLHGTLVALAEFAGGLAIVLGVFVPFAAVAFGFQMIVGTIWKITKAKKPFTDWSYDILLLALMILLLLTGPGIYGLTL